MKLHQLNLVTTLVKNNFNISKAAGKLNIVQSAASHQLALLENELGELFERRGKRLTGTTPLCDEILNHVERIQQAEENISSISSRYRRADVGELRVATTHAQAKYFLPMVIKQFHAAYPQVTIYFQQGNPKQLVEMLLDRETDVAVCTEELGKNKQLVSVPCYDWNHFLIAPAGHPLMEGEITLERLAEHRILTYVFGFTGRMKIQQAFDEAGLEPTVVFAAADTDVIKTYVRMGFGVGIIAGMCCDEREDEDMVVCDLSAFFPVSTTKIAYLQDKYLNQFIVDFIEMVKQHRPKTSTERRKT